MSRPITLKKSAGIIGLALAGLFCLVFSTVENWRARRAWQAFAASQKALGIDLNWEACLPAPVADSNNFALNLYLKPELDFLPGTQELKTSQAETPFMRAMAATIAFAKSNGIDYPPTSPTNRWWWQLGQTADLRVLLGTKPSAIPVEARLPDLEWDCTAQFKAAQMLREIQRPNIDPMLEELRAASVKTACRFPLRYEWVPIWGISLNHLNTLKSLADQASRRAQARLMLGETARAFADLRLVLYLSDTLRGEPFYISDAIRLTCRQYATQVIYDGLTRHQWTQENLQSLLASLLKDDFLADAHRALKGTLAADLRMIDQARTGQDGYSLDDLLENDEGMNSRRLFAPCHWVIPSGWLDFEKIQLAQTYDPQLIALDSQDKTSLADRYKNLKDLVPIDEWQLLQDLKSHRLMTRLFCLPPRYVKKAIQSHVANQQLIIACALEQHFLAKGDYPEDLSALIPEWLARLPDDPMTGQPFHYRKTRPHHYLLYSTGANGSDDNGEISTTKEGRPEPEKGDWVWQL